MLMLVVLANAPGGMVTAAPLGSDTVPPLVPMGVAADVDGFEELHAQNTSAAAQDTQNGFIEPPLANRPVNAAVYKRTAIAHCN
jgi:hypothetical protein